GRCRKGWSDAARHAMKNARLRGRFSDGWRSAFLRRRRRRRRTRHHDHLRPEAPRAVTPATTAPPGPEWIARAPRSPRIRPLHVYRPLRPQVNRVGRDARIGVIVFADLVLDGAVQRTRHRDLAAFGKHFRIVEPLLARDEATEAFFAAAVRPRLRIQWFGQHVETRLLFARLGFDDLSAPSHGCRRRGTAAG